MVVFTQSLHSRRQASHIDEDGTYHTGLNAKCRREADAATDRLRGGLKEAIDEHPASRCFREQRLLGFGDKLTDGFRARFSREVLLVDASVSVDEKLWRIKSIFSEFVVNFRRGCSFAEHTLELVIELASAVYQAFGGDWQESAHRLSLDSIIEGVSYPEDLPLGYFFFPPMYYHGVLPGDLMPMLSGVGLCRHRAIFFKYLCDSFNIVPCALLDGLLAPEGLTYVDRNAQHDYYDHMWNLVLVNGQPFVVDCMMADGNQVTPHSTLLVPGHHLSLRYVRAGGRDGFESLVMEEMAESPEATSCPQARIQEEGTEEISTTTPRHRAQRRNDSPSSAMRPPEVAWQEEIGETTPRREATRHVGEVCELTPCCQTPTKDKGPGTALRRHPLLGETLDRVPGSPIPPEEAKETTVGRQVVSQEMDAQRATMVYSRSQEKWFVCEVLQVWMCRSRGLMLDVAYGYDPIKEFRKSVAAVSRFVRLGDGLLEFEHPVVEVHISPL